MSGKSVFLRDATGLVRNIAPIDSFVMAVQGITVIGPFLFFAGFMYLVPNDNVILAIAIMAPIITAQAASWALLMVVLPRSGGDYVFNSRLIHPAVGLAVDFTQVAQQPGLAPIFYIVGLGVLADMFAIEGIATNNSSLTAISSAIFSPNIEFIITSILLLIALFFLVGRVRLFARYQTVVVLAQFAAAFLVIGVMAATTASTYASTFTNFFKVDYNSVIQSATQAGMPSVGWTGVTLFGITQIIWWLAGAQWATYVAGETRRPQKTALVAIVGAQVVMDLIYLVLGPIALNAFGFKFSYAINYLANTGKSPIPFADYATFLNLAAPILGSPILIAIVFLLMAAGSFAYATFACLAASRKIFAWSFDRVFPSKFSDVSDRFRTPIYSAVLVWILAEVFTAIYIFGPGIWAVISGFGAIGVCIFIGAAAISGVLLPLKHNIWDQAPPLARKKIGPVPIVSLLSAIVLVTVLPAAVFGQILPSAMGGLPVAPTAWMLGVLVGGAVWYYIAKWYRLKYDGFDLSLVYKEIPPE